MWLALSRLGNCTPSSLWNEDVGASVPDATIMLRAILEIGWNVTAGFMHIIFNVRMRFVVVSWDEPHNIPENWSWKKGECTTGKCERSQSQLTLPSSVTELSIMNALKLCDISFDVMLVRPNISFSNSILVGWDMTGFGSLFFLNFSSDSWLFLKSLMATVEKLMNFLKSVLLRCFMSSSVAKCSPVQWALLFSSVKVSWKYFYH